MLRVISIAAVLGALVTLAAEHRTQAQNVPGVSWIFADAFAPNPFTKSEEDHRDLGYVDGRNIGENRAGKISSEGGSGGRRCEMSPEEFAKFYPPLLDWIRATLTGSMHIAQTVASRKFSRLPLYFTENTLASTMVVLVDPLPMPPLSSMGLARFADSAQSIMASGFTAAQTGRTHDRTRPMLQQRQKVLAKAPSTHDP